MNWKYICRKVITAVLVAITVISVSAGRYYDAKASSYTGRCGNNVTYSFNAENGELTISGNGAMYDFSAMDSMPWCDFMESIIKVNIEYGVTKIGRYAFCGCSNMTSVIIPTSVTGVGNSAFQYCSSLLTIDLPYTLTSIGEQAFTFSGLQWIFIPESISTIVERTFIECYSLEFVYIPESVTVIQGSAFAWCENLTSIFIPDSVTSIGEDAFNGVPLVTVNCDNTIVSETNKYGARGIRVSHYIEEVETIGAVCEEQIVVGTCQTCGESEAEQIIPKDPTGHVWREPEYEWSEDYSSVSAIQVCEVNAEHIQTIETVDTVLTVLITPTCETAGLYQYVAEFTNPALQTQIEIVDIDALGHEWEVAEWHWDGYESAYADLVCQRDNDHTAIREAEITSEVTDPATCENTGIKTYTATVSIDGQIFTDTAIEILSQTGHDYYVYQWRWTGYESAIAILMCRNNYAHTIPLTATIGSHTTEPTCEGEGLTVYTATVEYDGKTYTDDKEAVIPPLGHAWGEASYLWAGDNSTVTASATCTRDPSHTVSEITTTTSEVLVKPTVDTEGLMRYTAVFENEAFTTQTKDVVMEKLQSYRITVLDEMFGNTITTEVAEGGRQFDEVLDQMVVEGSLPEVREGYVLVEFRDSRNPDEWWDPRWNEITEDTSLIAIRKKLIERVDITVDVPVVGTSVSMPTGKVENAEECYADYEENENRIGNWWVIRSVFQCWELIDEIDWQNTANEMSLFVLSGSNNNSTIIRNSPSTALVSYSGDFLADISSLSNGDRVIVYSLEEDMALSADSWNECLIGVEGNRTDNELTFANDALPAIFTITSVAGSEEKTYYFTDSSGQNLSVNYGDVTLNAENDRWIIEESGKECCYHIKNLDEEGYLIFNGWYDPVDTEDPDAVFESDTVYYLESELSSRDEYAFTGNTKVYVNGILCSDVGLFSGWGEGDDPLLPHLNTSRYVFVHTQMLAVEEKPHIVCDSMSTAGISLVWNDVSADSYELYRDGSLIKALTENTYLDNVGRTMGQEYSYKVRGVKNGEYTDFSDELTVLFNPFPDVEPGTDDFTHVAWAYNNEIVGGVKVDDHYEFKLNDPCTRAQFAIMLYKMNGMPDVSYDNNNLPFTDIATQTKNTKKAIIWCAESGIAGGSQGKFNPKGNITRVQLVIMIYKMAGTPSVTGLSCPFTDISDQTSNTKNAIIWAYNNNIIPSITGTKFSPKTKGTRALLTEMLYGFNQIYHLTDANH